MMIPAYYEYFNPVKILSGHRALENIPFELSGMGVSRPLIVTDQGVAGAGLVKIVLEAFAGSGIVPAAVFDQTPPDSSNRVVNQVARLYRENHCDSLIAVGGGSVMDTAKGVNIVITEDSDDLMKFVGAERLRKKMRPLIAIPTTSGTGSEATMVAVITNVDKGTKMAFTSYMLFPDVAVLDVRMTLTVPPAITAATGMDALTHAVEAYTCLQKNPLSDAYSVAAIRLIRKNLVQAVQSPRDQQARLALANASLMAGASFSNSMVGVVHAMGHACGGVSHIPHGMVMSILLPHGMEYNLEKVGEYYGELLLPLAGADEYAHTPEGKRPARSIQVIRELNQNLHRLSGMPLTLKDAGVKRESLVQIAQAAIGDGSLIFNPVEVEYNDVLDILKSAY